MSVEFCLQQKQTHDNNPSMAFVRPGGVAQTGERSLCMREARGSIPRTSISILHSLFPYHLHRAADTDRCCYWTVVLEEANL